jgi:hypothetical protein
MLKRLKKGRNLKKLFSLFFIILCLGIFAYKKLILPYIYDYKFDQALIEAAKVPENAGEEKYKSMPIKDKYKIVIVSNNGGEYSYAEYLKYAAEKNGWEVKIYINNTIGYEESLLSFDPDFILYSHHAMPNENQEISRHRSKKYVISFMSLRSMRDDYNFIDHKNPYLAKKEFYSFISSVDGIITSEKEMDIFRIMFERMNKNFNGIRMFPLAPRIDNVPAEPDKLMWIGTMWDKLRSSERYRNFMVMLSENIPMKSYGRFRDNFYLKEVYDGSMPSAMEIFDAIRKNGVYLLTHSDSHIDAATPTLRIFEAVAANVVVISDRHPFAIEHFGDNFLYFDQNADSEAMYKQVKAHYDWIKANPEKAKAMAARAHQIFLEKFTVEKDLIRIAKMHEYVIQQEKEMGLSYPLAY